MKNWTLFALIAMALSSVACASGMHDMRRELDQVKQQNAELRTDVERSNAARMRAEEERRDLDRIAEEAVDPNPQSPSMTPRPVPVAAPVQGAPAMLDPRYGTNAIMPHPTVCMMPMQHHVVHTGAAPRERVGMNCNGNCLEIRANNRLPPYVALAIDGKYAFACAGGQSLTSYAIVPSPGGDRKEGHLYIAQRPAVSNTAGRTMSLYLGPGKHDLTAIYYTRTPNGLFIPVKYEERQVQLTYSSGKYPDYIILGNRVHHIDEY